MALNSGFPDIQFRVGLGIQAMRYDARNYASD